MCVGGCISILCVCKNKHQKISCPVISRFIPEDFFVATN